LTGSKEHVADGRTRLAGGTCCQKLSSAMSLVPNCILHSFRLTIKFTEFCDITHVQKFVITLISENSGYVQTFKLYITVNVEQIKSRFEVGGRRRLTSDMTQVLALLGALTQI